MALKSTRTCALLLNTVSHTDCSEGGWNSWNTDLWFKIKFDNFFCFSDVVIIQGVLGWNAYRMQGAKVFVVNTETVAKE